MAKCVICNSRKGKRNCPISKTFICSVCCGQTRKESTCADCSYFQNSKMNRNYSSLPKYPLQDMENDPDLKDYADVIESALCSFDNSEGNTVSDEFAIRILELLLDKFYFKDSEINVEDDLKNKGFYIVLKAVEEDLENISDEVISKILSTIHFVAKRRTTGHREYFDVIHSYVGIRVGKGMRVIKDLPDR